MVGFSVHFFFLCFRNKEKEKRTKEKRKCEELTSLCDCQGKKTDRTQ